MNVLTAAWVGAGSPARSQPAPGSQPCARCGCPDGVVPVRAAVSKSFSAFDEWVSPRGGALCDVCGWGYSTAALRAVPHVVIREPATLQTQTREQVTALLGAGGLGAQMAVVVPLKPGRKHLVPDAVWGQVSVDDARLPWHHQDAELLQIVLELRELGFGTRMLTAPAPALTVLRTLPRRHWVDVLGAWEQLSRWRRGESPWFRMVLHITTPTTGSSR